MTAYLQHQRVLFDVLSSTCSESTLCEVKFPKLSVLNVLEKVSSFSAEQAWRVVVSPFLQ